MDYHYAQARRHRAGGDSRVAYISRTGNCRPAHWFGSDGGGSSDDLPSADVSAADGRYRHDSCGSSGCALVGASGKIAPSGGYQSGERERMSKLQCAFVGCGGVAERYWPIYRSLDFVEVPLCIDVDLPVAERA